MMPEAQPQRPETPEGLQTITAADLKTQRIWGVAEPVAEAVDLLLKRMESNPEEFDNSSYSKWGDFIIPLERRINGEKSHLSHLTDNECETLWAKYREIKRKDMHHLVMERILTNEKPYQMPAGHFPSRVNVTKRPPTINPAPNSIGSWGMADPALAQGTPIWTSAEQPKELTLTEMLKARLGKLGGLGNP